MKHRLGACRIRGTSRELRRAAVCNPSPAFPLRTFSLAPSQTSLPTPAVTPLSMTPLCLGCPSHPRGDEFPAVLPFPTVLRVSCLVSRFLLHPPFCFCRVRTCGAFASGWRRPLPDPPPAKTQSAVSFQPMVRYGRSNTSALPAEAHCTISRALLTPQQQ